MSYPASLGVLKKWIGWFIFSGLVFAAIYVSLGQILLANVDGFRKEILVYVRDNYQIDVTLGEMRGSWHGLNPRLHISNLVIGTTGADQTRFDELEIELDPLASLLNHSWVVSHFYGSGLNTTLGLKSNGELQISGIPPRESATDPNLVLDLLVYTRHFTLTGMNVSISTEHGAYVVKQPDGMPFELVSQQHLKTVSLILDWKRQDRDDQLERTGTIQVIGEFSGDPRQLDSFYSKSYLKITPFHLHDFIPDYAYKDVQLNRFMFGGEFWLTARQGELDLVGNFDVPELELTASANPVNLARQFSGRIQFVGRELWDWRARLDQMSFVHDETTRSIADLQIIAFSENDTRRIVANLGAHNLANLTSFLLKIGEEALPGKSYSILESMNPRGNLAETYLDLKRIGEETDFRLMARIDQGELNAYLGSPMIDNLDALVSVGPRDLWVDVHNGPYNMRFASIFDEIWHFDSAAGRVKIQYQPGTLTIGSELLTVKRAGMTVNGKFHLNLEQDRRTQTWGLILGISDGDASEKSPFLPNNLSPALHEWLDRAVVQGRVLDGGLLFHGSLSAEAPPEEKLHEYYFRVADSVLDYHPDWQRLTGIQALVNGGNWGVSSSGVVAAVQDCAVSADVLVPFDAEGQTSFVNVTGNFVGESQSVLDFIKYSPVANMTNQVSVGWVATGPVRGDMDLAIPINAATHPDGSPLYAFDGSVTGQLDSVQLSLPQYNLMLENIKTDLTYTARSGINTDKFKASLFGFPITGRLHTSFEDPVQRSAGTVQLDFTGKSSIDAIRTWSGISFLAIADGESDFDATLLTPFGPDPGQPSFLANSNLLGVSIELPEPLSKAAETPMPMQYTVTFGTRTTDMSLALGAQVKASLQLQAGSLTSGLVAINDELSPMPEESGLRISGFIDQIDYADWSAFNEKLASIHEASTGLSYSDQFGSLIRQINIRTTDFRFRDVNLLDLALVADRGEGLWSVSISNEQVSGSISLLDDASQPLEIDLDYLRLTTDEADQQKDPLALVSPDNLRAARLKVNEFLINGEDYGSWQFSLKPRDSYVEIADLFAAVKGLHIHGEGETGATLDWITGDQNPKSVFNGKISSPNFGEALIEWGLAPSIEGETFSFDASLNWPGSPAMIARNTIEGRVRVDSQRGRIVQATGGGPMKLLGIFDFASLGRRFRLDFSDVASEGYEFNSISGEWRSESGIVSVTKPITIKGASSSFKIGGKANVVTGEINGDMIVTLPVSRNLPWYSAVMVSPVVGAGVYLVQKVFEDQIDQFSSAKYQVTGTMDEPVIEFVNIFNNTVREDQTPDNAVELPGAVPQGEVKSQ